MSLVSPADRYHAELRQQLSLVGRALAVQRGLRWLMRGVLLGLLVDCGAVGWMWTHGLPLVSPTTLRFGLPAGVDLVGLPIVAGVLAALASLIARPGVAELARQVDRAAALQERSVTALELSAQRVEHPLALAQMRDAVEHLHRLDPFHAFAPRVSRRELVASGLLAAAAASVALSPNPWLARVSAMSPAAVVAVDQAQRIERVAAGLQDQSSPEVAALRDRLDQGAASVKAQSSDPASALQSLQNLQSTVAQMQAGDSQLTNALGAAANALASSDATRPLANAVQQGDPRATAQALRDLAQQISQLSPDQQAQLASTLNNAAAQAAGASSDAASQLGAAAQALDNTSPAAASQALDNLANGASAAAERARAADQVQSSAEALARALGVARSSAGQRPNAAAPSQQAGQTGQNGQNGQNGQSGQAGQSGPAGQAGQSGQAEQAADQAGQASDQAATDGQSGQAGQNGQAGQSDSQNGSGQGDQPGGDGQGSGYSTGGHGAQHTGSPSQLDASGQIQRVPNPNQARPDQSSPDPNLAPAPSGSAQASNEAVNPAYSSASTQADGGQDVPQGLRDLVRDYFSSQPGDTSSSSDQSAAP